MTLREARDALGWTQDEAGWWFGVERATYGSWEQGRRRRGYPDAALVLTVLAAAYGRRKAHLALEGRTPEGKPFPGLLTARLARMHRHQYRRVPIEPQR